MIKQPRRQKFIRRHYLFAIKNEADFARLRASMDDGDLWPSYAEWCENQERSLAAFTRAGTLGQKIEVDPDQFVAWCKLHGRTLDSASRSLYAAFKGEAMTDAGN